MIRRRARARPNRTPGTMNKTELAYSQLLELRRLAGEIRVWGYEPVKLRLAERTFYTPDFMVILPDGLIEFHEVKAITKNDRWLIEDDAAVKIKVAAEQHQWAAFIKCGKKPSGAWEYVPVGPHAKP